MTRHTWKEWYEIAKNGNGEDECWEVPLHPNGDRRLVYYKGRDVSLTRVIYLEFIGPIPGKLLVCHACHNKACVNPKHLFLGNQSENMVSSAKSGWPNGRGGGERLFDRVQAHGLRAEGLSWYNIGLVLGVSGTAIRHAFKNRSSWQ